MSNGGDGGYEHFPIPYVPDHRPARRKPRKTKGKRRGLPIHRSVAKPGELVANAEGIYQRSLLPQMVHSDDRVYFKIQFAGEIGLSPINAAIEGLKGEVVKIFPDNQTLKLAIRKSEFPAFKLRLRAFKGVIDRVTESSLSDIADKELIPKLLKEPSRRLSVTLRLFDASGLKIEAVEAQIGQYLGHDSTMEQVYLAGNWALYTIGAISSDILSIIENVGPVDHVQELPPIALAPTSKSRRRTDVSLASIIDIQSSKASANDLPRVCIVDSGVNRTHRLLSSYIDGTWDFGTDSEGPCTDNDGHGSMVAGIAVHGGNLETNTKPVSRVIMVKAFENDKPIRNRGMLKMVRSAISQYGSIAKVFNLSFAAKGPNIDLSQTLSDEIYKKGVVVVVAAGNIDPDFIMEDLNNGDSYPDYLLRHFMFFPGDVENAITVGSLASKASNRFQDKSPSPFTKVGSDSGSVKPDVLAEGGNLNVVSEGETVIGLNKTDVGITSTGPNGNEDMPESVGTSFASPAIASLAARILDKYPNASPFLIKALILSSAESLEGPGMIHEPTSKSSEGKSAYSSRLFEPFPALIQGYGRVDFRSALSSSDWRASYLLQGDFNGLDTLEVHNYEFKVANQADSISIMFVAGRPAWSSGYFTFKVTKSGPKDQTISKFDESQTIGDPKTGKHIVTTYRRIYPKSKGGVGIWKLQVIPHFSKVKGIDPSLKYGCVITVHSSSSPTMYREISNWLDARRKLAEALLKQEQPPKIAAREREEPLTLARVP